VFVVVSQMIHDATLLSMKEPPSELFSTHKFTRGSLH